MAKVNVIFMFLEMNKISKARTALCELQNYTLTDSSSRRVLAEAEVALFFQKMTIKEYLIAYKLYESFLLILDVFFTRDVGRLKLQEAVNILHDCLKCSVKHHIAWYHLGMADRTLWVCDNNFEKKIVCFKRDAPVNFRTVSQYSRLYISHDKTVQSSHDSRWLSEQSQHCWTNIDSRHQNDPELSENVKYITSAFQSKDEPNKGQVKPAEQAGETKVDIQHRTKVLSHMSSKPKLHYTDMNLYNFLMSSNPNSHSRIVDEYLYRAKDFSRRRAM